MFGESLLLLSLLALPKISLLRCFAFVWWFPSCGLFSPPHGPIADDCSYWMLWIELCFPRRHVEVLTLRTVNMAFLEKRVCADVIKLRWGHTGLQWTRTLIQYDCSFKEENIHTHTHTEGDITMKAEVGVMCLQAKECQQPLEARKKQGYSPGAFRGSEFLWTSWFQTSSLQNHERINVCCFKSLG